MDMEINFCGLTVQHGELCRGEYCCEPKLCGEGVCCAHFDIAITLEEHERISGLLARVLEFCPWVVEEGASGAFKRTPSEIFINKRPGGKCWFNFRTPEGRWLCGLHAAALKAGENPYAWKPLNCALWPFLRDGAGNLTLDTGSGLPCVRGRDDANEPDKELYRMIGDIAEALGDVQYA